MVVKPLEVKYRNWYVPALTVVVAYAPLFPHDTPPFLLS